VSKLVWWKLSTPWAEQKEQKTAHADAQLLDLITCKEVILSQATEKEGSIRLQQALDADRQDIRRICVAVFCSEIILVSAFALFVPLLLWVVYVADPNMERLFQLLIMIVVSDEMTKAFLMYRSNVPIHEEYQRAKAKFRKILGVPEDILFPPDFPWLHHQPHIMTHNSPKDHGPTSDGLMEADKVVATNEAEFLDEELSKSVEMSLRSPASKDCISLEGISFGYTMVDGSTFYVVDNLSLSFDLGGHYAIMGETGAGKSTIFKVQMSFSFMCVAARFLSTFYASYCRGYRASLSHLMATLRSLGKSFILGPVDGESKWALLARRRYC